MENNYGASIRHKVIVGQLNLFETKTPLIMGILTTPPKTPSPEINPAGGRRFFTFPLTLYINSLRKPLKERFKHLQVSLSPPCSRYIFSQESPCHPGGSTSERALSNLVCWEEAKSSMIRMCPSSFSPV